MPFTRTMADMPSWRCFKTLKNFSEQLALIRFLQSTGCDMLSEALVRSVKAIFSGWCWWWIFSCNWRTRSCLSCPLMTVRHFGHFRFEAVVSNVDKDLSCNEQQGEPTVVPTIRLVSFPFIDGDNHCVFQVSWDIVSCCFSLEFGTFWSLTFWSLPLLVCKFFRICSFSSNQSWCFFIWWPSVCRQIIIITAFSLSQWLGAEIDYFIGNSLAKHCWNSALAAGSWTL